MKNETVYNDIDGSHLELSNYLNKPTECYKTIKSLFIKSGKGFKPNVGHEVIAKLGQANIVKSVITQNVDNLHQEAGSDAVFELHGNAKEMVCTECKHIDSICIDDVDYPTCSKCGALSKPGFTFFGEDLPVDDYTHAYDEIMKCDLMIIIGCSGEVFPAAGLPKKAKENGAFLIEINTANTSYRRLADIVVHSKAGEVLSKIYDEMYGL